MITILQAKKKYCERIKCGYCLTHDKMLPCDAVVNVFIKNNGKEWCKKHIDEFCLMNYKSMSDKEVGEVFEKYIDNIDKSVVIKNDGKIPEKKLYEFSLLDLLERGEKQ